MGVAQRRQKDQDLLSIYRRLQAALATLPDGQAFVLPPPPIQGIGNAGGFQMQLELLGGSFDYQKLNDLAQEIVKQARATPLCSTCSPRSGPTRRTSR